MAPEQLAGKGAVRAERPLRARPRALRALHRAQGASRPRRSPSGGASTPRSSPPRPRRVTPGFDPVVERVILRCLEKDPKARPRSVAAVAAALPGGDPLAAALAAGETPSPEMVAAAGSDEGMKPAAAWACLVADPRGNRRSSPGSRPAPIRHGHVPLEKPPEVLAERSKEIVRKLGYTEKPLGHRVGLLRKRRVPALGRGARQVQGPLEGHGRRASGRDLLLVPAEPRPARPERFRGEDAGGLVVTESDPPPLRRAE